MYLHEKLNSMTPNNTVAELSQMLNRQTDVSISWFGQRLVSINGYEGSVTINELASKYLASTPFKANGHASLKGKLDCL